MLLARTCVTIMLAAVGLCAQSQELTAILNAKRIADPRPSAGKDPVPKEILLRTADLFLPQVASSGSLDLGGIVTFLNLTNLTDRTATYSVLFLDDQGNPLEMPLARPNSDGTLCLECPPFYSALLTGTLLRGQALQQVLLPAGPPRVGWAGILVDPPVSVGVTGTFMQIVPGRPLFMAGIPPSTAVQQRAWLNQADVGGFTTSIAMINTDPNQAQNFTLIYRENFGRELCRTTFPISPFGHSAFLVRDVLPCAAGREGSVEIVGTRFFSGLGFWAHDTGGFVTQPLLEPDPLDPLR